MNSTVEKVFNQIKSECRPNKDMNFGDVFEMFFQENSILDYNFVGGMNDKRNTLHENLFYAMNPRLERQVHFGTGKGGYEKYLSKRYTADFYDREKNVVYEIDGHSHKAELQMLKDQIRDYFFFHELGIKTVRVSNKKVEKILLNHLERLHEAGVLNE